MDLVVASINTAIYGTEEPILNALVNPTLDATRCFARYRIDQEDGAPVGGLKGSDCSRVLKSFSARRIRKRATDVSTCQPC